MSTLLRSVAIAVVMILEVAQVVQSAEASVSISLDASQVGSLFQKAPDTVDSPQAGNAASSTPTNMVATPRREALSVLRMAERVSLDADFLGAAPGARLVLHRIQPVAETVQFLVVTDGRQRSIEVPALDFFTGKLEGSDDSLAYLMIAGSDIYGFVQSSDVFTTLSPSRGGRVSVQRVAVAHDATPPSLNAIMSGPTIPSVGFRTAGVFVEVDTELRDRFSTAGAAATYVAALVGATSAIYERDARVIIRLATVRVWEGSDPWTPGNSSHMLDELQQYHANPANVPQGVERDLIHLVSGKPGLRGVAWIGSVCDVPYNVAVSVVNGSFNMEIPSQTWDVKVFSHETGHTLGSPHTHCYDPPIDRCYNLERGCYSGPRIEERGEFMSYCQLNTGGLAMIDFRIGDRVRDQILGTIEQYGAGCVGYGCRCSPVDAPQSPPVDGFWGTDGNGRLATGFAGNDDFATSITLQSDGKVVVGGVTRPTTALSDFAVVRYLPNGVRDPNFGSDGRVTVGYSLNNDDVGRAVAMQADGKILVAGSTRGENASESDFAIARLTSTGTLDGTFGSNGDGLVATGFDTNDDQGMGMALLQSGKIVIAGSTRGANATESDFAVARYNSNGVLDTSFGPDGNGKVATTFGANDDQGRAVLALPDGKVVVVGATRGSAAVESDFAIARYLSNGSLDPSFGTDGNGKMAHAWRPGSDDQAWAVARQSDGKLVLVGSTKMIGEVGAIRRAAIMRITENGLLDTSFGGGTGWVVSDFGCDGAEFTSVMWDGAGAGSIVAGGTSKYSCQTDAFLIARFNLDGSFAPTVVAGGTLGFGMTQVAAGGTEGRAIALQPNAQILIAGSTIGAAAAERDFAVVRYGGPATGTCQVPTVLSAGGGEMFGTTQGDSAQRDPTFAGTGASPEVVYAWTAPTAGTVTADTCGAATSFDTVLYVREAPCNTGSRIAISDDACAIGTGQNFGSRVSFPAQAGSTYYFIVDGYSSSARGSFRLRIAPAGAPQPPVASEFSGSCNDDESVLRCGPCEVCDADSGECVARPRMDCTLPDRSHRASLTLRPGSGAELDQMSLVWKSGTGLSLSELGELPSNSDLYLCVFGDGAGTADPVEVEFPSTPICSGLKGCWTERGSRRTFKNKVPESSSAQSASVSLSRTGSVSAQFKAKGEFLGVDSLPFLGPVVAEIRSLNSGRCWSTGNIDILKNDASGFRGKGPGLP